MRSFMKRIKSFMTTIGLFLIGALMPDHSKRMLMLTSLHMQLVQEGIFREDALDRLNRAMDLTGREDALLFPAHVYRSIWEHTALKESLHSVEGFDFSHSCLPFEEAKKLAEEITAHAIPTWLKYGLNADMVNDIIRLFYCQPSLSRQAMA